MENALKQMNVSSLTGEGEDTSFFILPDLGTGMAKIEGDVSLTDETKLQNKNMLQSRKN